MILRRVGAGLSLLTVLALVGCSTSTNVTSTSVPSSTPVISDVPTATAIPTATDAPDSVGVISIACKLSDDDVDEAPSLVEIPLAGTPDFKFIWTYSYVSCDATRDDVPLTPIETAAMKADGSAGDTIDDLYGYCATNDPTDVYAEAKFVASEDQIPEIAAQLVLCPAHPNAPAWRKSLARGEALVKLTKSGRTFGDGVHLVGKEIKAGTYVVTGDISGCYWERQNRNGGIIANDFIAAARRVQVTIRSSDYAFSSEGCGDWKPA